MKKYYSEPERKIPVCTETDVLVVGSGPAGFSAAINAARNGVDTVLIEQSGTVGGMATAGLMSHWTGETTGGFYEEILDRSSDGVDRHIINPEKLKIVMLKMLCEAGVELHLYTFACGVIMKGSSLCGVITESKSGREAFMSRIIIDASGDGDIAAKAGVPFQKGRKDGKMQPVTLMFKVAGVDTARVKFIKNFESSYGTLDGDLQSLAKKTLPFPAGHILIYPTTLPGVVTCNMTNCTDVDGTKKEDLTKAEYTCRSQLEPIVAFLQKYVPGFEKCFLISSASIIGVRETRHFKGEYMLTEKDILKARVFKDWVVTKAHFNFDVHNIEGSGIDETGIQEQFPQYKGYTIPYRCLLPKKVENLLLAGRNISGTHMAHSNFRAMPICANIGQAAGIAGALSVKEGVSPRKLAVEKIQKILKKSGVRL
ncbi:MAG: FAD-dependent oxidoreductase [Candidatus Omnitrophica bacterium]|nr:FAD-dependent oxidoreductase [Candidatus Omnitrophota bacterium]